MQDLKSQKELRDHYGTPSEISANKDLDRLDEHSIRFISLSPFAVLGTADLAGNCEVSPRGDAPGFVHVENPTTLQLPDRAGNNRADSNSKLIANPKASIIFFVPGLGETLRVSGSVRIRIDEGLRARFTSHGKAPRAVLEMDITRVIFQCQKALLRSGLWDPDRRIDRETEGVASLGAIFADQIGTLDPDRAEALIESSVKERMW